MDRNKPSKHRHLQPLHRQVTASHLRKLARLAERCMARFCPILSAMLLPLDQWARRDHDNSSHCQRRGCPRGSRAPRDRVPWEETRHQRQKEANAPRCEIFCTIRNYRLCCMLCLCSHSGSVYFDLPCCCSRPAYIAGCMTFEGWCEKQTNLCQSTDGSGTNR
ncbi:hypothetical protein ACQKWADRAFT_280924 [Trichoderma austrokoningii]